MASLFRPVSVKPIPPLAERVTVNRQPCVRWRNRRGEWIVAQVTADGTRCRVRSPYFWIEYWTATGERKREKVSTLRAAAENRLGEIVRDVERARGNLPPLSVARDTVLLTLARQYRDHLRDMGRTPKHYVQTHAQIAAVVADCEWLSCRDVQLSDWTAWVGRQREEGLAAETINHYLRALRGFCRWLVPEKMSVDPLSRAQYLNAEADRKVFRRVLEPADFRRLVDIARASADSWYGLDGPDRAALYLLAASTGLRAGELAALERADVKLDAVTPFVVAHAKRAKSRRAAQIPLPDEIVRETRSWLDSRPAGPLWPDGWRSSQHAAGMLRRDLAEARIPYKTADGVFDFHSLRSQYATGLALAGVPIQVAQQLLRHSTPTLTAKHYTRLKLADLANAANQLGRQMVKGKKRAGAKK